MDKYDKLINPIKKMEPRELGLYIHIPFCVKKCDYCDFLSTPASEETKRDYILALLTEIESYYGRTKDYIVPTIFFGGGTPSCIDAAWICTIMDTIRKVFILDTNRLEATIEVNPGIVDLEKLQLYREAGINRLSFGLQSTDNRELKLLGRIHTYEQFKDNYQAAREVGFSNINVDLMSALPGQTLKSWENTLNTVISLKPEHISAYSLIIEEGTKFYDRYQPGSVGFQDLPDEDTDRLIYYKTKEILELSGYQRYEISNYAKRGYECRHNSSYWIGTDYLGIGLGASSLLNGARFSNLHTNERYIQLCNEYENCKSMLEKHENIDDSQKEIMKDILGLRQDFEQLTIEQRMEEFMFLGLRMCGGISQSTFFRRFHTDIDTIYGDVIRQLIKKELIIKNDDTIRLTEYGIDVSNSVLSVFLLN